MIHIYEYSGGISGIVIANVGKSYSSILLYDGSVLDSVTTYDEISRKEKALTSYVVCSYLINKTWIPFEQFGSFSEFESLMMLKKTILNLLDGKTVSSKVGLNDVTIRYVTSIEGKTLTRRNMHASGLRYRELNKDKMENFNLVNKLSKLATVEDMKKRYDCSWVFNKDGTMKKRYSSVTTMEELLKLDSDLSKLPDNYFTGYDVETSGVDFFYDPTAKTDRLLGFSISWEDDQGVYVPLESKVFSCLDIDTVMNVIYKQLIRLRIIAHNGIFEWKSMYHSGRTIKISEDTQGIDFNLNTKVEKGWATLKNLTRFWFGDETWEYNQLFGGEDNVDPEMLVYLPLDLLTIYGCADSDYARKLYFRTFDILNDSQKFSYRLDMEIIEILGKADYYGTARDMNAVKKNSEVYTKDLIRLECIMEEYIRTYGLQVAFEEELKRIIVKANELWGDREYGEEYNKFIEDCIEKAFNEELIREEFNKLINKVLEGNKFRGAKLYRILFQILKYPILTYTKPSKAQKKKEAVKKLEAQAQGIKYVPPAKKPSTDEKAMKKLMSYKLKEPNKIFKEDFYSINPKDGKPMLRKDELNNLKYPFAMLLDTWRDLDKMLTTFLSSENVKGSPYIHGKNMEFGTVTARIASNMHTISKDAKDMVVPYPNTYGINADYSQFEIRFMAGEANKFWETEAKHKINMEELSVYHRNGMKGYINKLNNPETDIHTETAAEMNRISPDAVEKQQRSDAKASSFGVPYGRSSHAMSMDDIVKYADQTKDDYYDIVSEIDFDNGLGMDKWTFSNFILYEYLEYTRDSVLKNAERGCGKIPEYFGNTKYGYVENPLGRRRYFDVEDLNKFEIASMRKEAGNFPIQSGTREYFFLNKLNLYSEAKKRGLVKNPTNGERPEPDKFIMGIFVHDEFFGYSGLEIHPYYYVKMIYDNCFIKIKYHPNYYLGINFINNWYEGKSGKNEMPVDLVVNIATMSEEDYPEYEDGYFIIRDSEGIERNRLWVVDYFAQIVKEWKHQRVVNEIITISQEQGLDVENFVDILEYIRNYFVASLVREVGSKFLDTKEDAKLLQAVWDNRYFNYLLEEVECSRMECNQELEEDLFGDLLAEESEFNTNALNEIRDSLGKEAVQNCMFTRDDIEFKFEEAERKEYVSKNLSLSGEENPNIILRIDGKLIINMTDIYPALYNKFYNEIKEEFGDSNGSIFEVITNLGLKRLDFRVFNLDRKKIELIYDKYVKESESLYA